MHTVVEKILRSIAEFVEKEKIHLCVTNGIEPTLGTLGRDIDAYVANKPDAIKVMCKGRELLLQNGFRWVAITNPLWGYRCVGIHEDGFEYLELHIKTDLSIGHIDVRSLFKDKPVRGYHGFLFDPGQMLFKFAFMKKRKALGSGEPLWRTNDEIMLRRFILDNLAESDLRSVIGSQGFFDTFLLDDGNIAAQKRVRLFHSILIKHLVLHPVLSIEGWWRWIVHKTTKYWSLCMPVFVLERALDKRALSEFLDRKVAHIFVGKVYVLSERLSWRRERESLARQHLIIYVHDRDLKRRRGDITINVSTIGTETTFDDICRFIFQEFCKYNNERWMSLCGGRH